MGRTAQRVADSVDPAIAAALERLVGHPLPVRDEEWAGIADLHVTHARDLAGIERCRDLTMLVLSGCGRIRLDPVAGLAKLEALVVNNSGLVSLDGLGEPPLILLDVSRNLLTDLTPLLAMSGLQSINTDGNPLSVESYDQVVPALRERGVRVSCSERVEWQLTLRMQAARLPYCCYRKRGELRLNSPGLGHTDRPEFGHPVVTVEELEGCLATDPAVIHELFARRERM